MSLLIIIILSIIVFLILLLPVRKKIINFDEKAYAIKVYKEELSILEHRKNTYRIGKKTYENLKIELERKSVLSFLSIDKKFFSYKESIIYIPICLIFIAIGGAFYAVHSGNNKSLEFLRFKDANGLKIEEGISNKFALKEFSKDEKELRYYCFSLQQLVLAKYTKNAEALANLAFCQMNMGTLALTQDTIKLGLQVNKNHPELNFLFAQTNLMRFRKLDKASKNALKVTLKENPEHMAALWLLGNYSYTSGNYEAAKFFLGKLKKLSANNETINNLLLKIEKEINTATKNNKVIKK